ncbi:SpoIIE family protein phosphatase [Bdellovibrio sp. HCB337]|uniref:SpoIIE family protein phosphatase n=1 Tax=Bdellovibrio sp. HCB337 TaxID=3394358 RepID=UPI0039A6A349
MLTLSIYLFLAVQIFESDKVAYVFDSSSNVSGAMASQVKAQLNSLLNESKPVFQDFLTNGDFTSQTSVFFASGSSLESVVAFRFNTETKKYEKKAFAEKTARTTEGILLGLEKMMQGIFTEVEAQGRTVKVPYQDDRLFIFEKVKGEKEEQGTIFMVIARLPEVAEMFRAQSSQRLYLVSRDGLILFGPEGTVGSQMQRIFPLRILENANNKVAQGAETVKDASGTELLVSYSRAGFGDLMVVSSVDKKKALGAVEILIRKSLIFFGILIAVTAIISLLASSSLTGALTLLFDATKKVAEGDFNIRVNVKSTDEVGTLADNFNLMAAEVSRLLDATAQKARMESELQTAKTVQETLFPETTAKIGPLSIAGYYEPASECGGDWWHYCQVGRKIFLWIGDATGHGAPAALITSAAKSASTIIERLNVNPAQALELLNRSIYDVSKGRIMMTFFLASFDPDTGEFTYANASHEAPFLIKKSENALKKKDLIPLNEVNNPRLGQGRDTKYKQTSVTLDPEDMVFFYTDGIPDIQNGVKMTWGEREFLKAIISTNKDYPSAQDSVDRLAQMIQDYRQGEVLIDDVTFFVVKNDPRV